MVTPGTGSEILPEVSECAWECVFLTGCRKGWVF